MGKLSTTSQKKSHGIKPVFLCAAVTLIFAGGLALVWPVISPGGDGIAYGAPCKIGEEPEYDSNGSLKEGSCEPVSLDDCDPQLERCSGETECTGDDCGLIDKYLKPIVNFLAIIVGLVITIALTAAGIMYSSAGDNPQTTAKAKNRIVQSLLALLAFVVLYLGLQWIIPGGFF